jgi:hypothetical protein
MRRLKANEIPKVREEIASIQNGLCAICQTKMEEKCLDHDHKTGIIRSVLCRNCNGIEGKIFNLCRRGKRNRTEKDFLIDILAYWSFHADLPRNIMHPTFKTQEEKRLARNRKARLRKANSLKQKRDNCS